MRLKFGEFVFDADARELRRAGRPVEISPKAFVLLEHLIECRGKAVSKSDIRSRLWPDTHVSDANLGNLVVELRAALEDDARQPRVIRTVARFGYAFIARASADRGHGPAELEKASLVYRLVWGRREIALEPGENLIGRDREALIWIDDESVSRRHARVSIGEEGATIEDLGSKNGTSVGGQKIQGPVRLGDRGVVKIGPATLTLRVLRKTGSTRSTVKERSPR